MTYGEAYQTYGNKFCRRCAQVHAQSQWVRETPQSRFKLMKLLAGMKIQHVTGQDDRMLGVLLTPVRNYAAQSGNTQGGNTPFLTRAAASGFTVCPPRSFNQGNRLGVNGDEVSQDLYRGSLGAGGFPPGACAAPRLIQQAIEDYLQAGRTIDPSQWAMSEVMFRNDPTMAPRGGGTDWVHGLTAFSCPTCDRLVPLFLCNNSPDMFQDDDLMGAFRKLMTTGGPSPKPPGRGAKKKS